MTKQDRINELVNKYKNMNDKEKNSTTSFMYHYYRDEKRAIKKTFLKEMHEPIDKYLK